MISVLIVDDDTIVRTSIKLLTDWTAAGIAIVGEASNGKQALEALCTTPVDVVLTDIKMPIMDGLGLLEAIAKLPNPPAAVVLSAYDEFPLVRRAFTLGAQDYLQKSEMNAESMVKCIQKAGEHALKVSSDIPAGKPAPGDALRQAALGEERLSAVLATPCVLACFELDDYLHIKERFAAALEKDLVRPLLDFAAQMPRLKEDCIFCNLSPARYLFAFQNCKSVQEAKVLCAQIAKTWKIYMNLSATAGLSGVVHSAEELDEALEKCMLSASMRFVVGPGKVLDAAPDNPFDVQGAAALAGRIAPLLAALKAGHDAQVNEERVQLFVPYYTMPQEAARQLMLAIVYQVALMLSTLGTSLSGAFDGEEYDYLLRARQMTAPRDCEIWTTNFLRHITNYLSREFDASAGDSMERAQSYLLDQYQNPAISVRNVADAAGLSEKYFSTRFNQSFGTSVSTYVNNLRIAKAKELLQQTELKVYEVAEAVGFSNTEHFIRVFRKQTGMPPSAYKKQNRTKCQ